MQEPTAMTDEKWLKQWSVARERGKGMHIAIWALSMGVGFATVWLFEEAYRAATGGYFSGTSNSPYWITLWLLIGAINGRIGWWLNERKYRRLGGKENW